MEIIKLTKNKYREWDEFCLASDDAWFWHTSAWLEYNLNYKIDSKPESKSFFMVQNGKIVAVCPLILENYDSGKEFSLGGIPGMPPAFSNNLDMVEKKKIRKYIFGEIDRLAEENGVRRTNLKFPVLNKSFIEANNPPNNYLIQFGYLDTSINTQIIDLKKTVDELRKEVRHGHDYDIDRSLKILKPEIFDSENINKNIFSQYVDLHHKAAGRITRPGKTFTIMYDLIKRGEAFLIGAKKDNSFVGFSYFFLYKNNVYYGSSCNDPEARDIPIAHFIQWKALEWMKKEKYNYYEIGWQEYGNTLSDFPSQKELDIGKFKRGFGGFTVPLFRGEKYYDKAFFLKVYNSRINQFAQTIE